MSEPTSVESEQGSQEMAVDASVHTHLNVSFTALSVWEATKGQLQMELPKAAFKTWVRGIANRGDVEVRFDLSPRPFPKRKGSL